MEAKCPKPVLRLDWWPCATEMPPVNLPTLPSVSSLLMSQVIVPTPCESDDDILLSNLPRPLGKDFPGKSVARTPTGAHSLIECLTPWRTGMGRSAVMSTVYGRASREILMCQQLGIDTMHIVSKSQQEMVSLDNNKARRVPTVAKERFKRF